MNNELLKSLQDELKKHIKPNKTPKKIKEDITAERKKQESIEHKRCFKENQREHGIEKRDNNEGPLIYYFIIILFK